VRIRALLVVVGLIFANVVSAEGGLRWRFSGPLAAEIKCLTDNIYFEARNQTEEGQKLIAHITWNRVNHEDFPDSICGVVWQQNKDRISEELVAHFSWTLDGKSDIPQNNELWQKLRNMSVIFLSERPEDPTNGGTHYHANYVTPYWADDLIFLVKVDTHLFYR